MPEMLLTQLLVERGAGAGAGAVARAGRTL